MIKTIINGVSVFSPQDRQLDGITVSRWFQQQLLPDNNVVLDLSDAVTVDVAGLAMLVEQALKGAYECAIVVEAESWAHSLCNTVKLGELIPIFYDLDSATQHMSALANTT